MNNNFSDKLADPFYRLYTNNLIDPNTKRAEKKETWIFTEEPYDFSQDMPKLSIQAIDINPRLLGDTYYSEDDGGEVFTYSVEFNIRISLFIKRVTNYLCLDNIIRKGKGFSEYFMLREIIPLFIKNRWELIRNNCWLDTIGFDGGSTNVESVDAENESFKTSCTLKCIGRMEEKIPMANNGYIKEIELDIDPNPKE